MVDERDDIARDRKRCGICGSFIAAGNTGRCAKCGSEWDNGALCPHDFNTREDAIYIDGMCPLCLCAALTSFRFALQVIAANETTDPQALAAEALEGK
jgi:ribosomal protein S27AE